MALYAQGKMRLFRIVKNLYSENVTKMFQQHIWVIWGFAGLSILL